MAYIAWRLGKIEFMKLRATLLRNHAHVEIIVVEGDNNT